MKQLRRMGTYLFLVSLLELGIACDNRSPVSPTFPTGPGGGMAGNGSGMGSIAGSVSTAEVVAAMRRAILDEYGAEETYLRVIADFGEIIAFTNVVYAEERHSESIARLYMNRSMPVPANPWNRDSVARFRSIPEACSAAVEAELQNVAMYDELLALELPFDVSNVFANNRRASLENHLPAFQLCAGT